MSLYAIEWKHPLECEVCDAAEQVNYSRLFAFEGGLVASQLSVPIACPHCKDGGPLRMRVSRATGLLGGEQ